MSDPGPSHTAPDRSEPMDELVDCRSMSQLIDILLGELGDGPEPLQPIPEELQPMLERLQRMAEANQNNLNPVDPLHMADQHQYPYTQEYPQNAAYDSTNHEDIHYQQAYQTISELCMIMTPGEVPEVSQAGYQSGMQMDMPEMYQPSTSSGYGYQAAPGAGAGYMPELPHMATGQPLSPTPTLRELLAPPKPNPAGQQQEQAQTKGDLPSPCVTGGLVLCRRSNPEHDDPDYWLNQI